MGWNEWWITYYCDTYILMCGTLIVTESAADGGNNNIQVISKNFAPFTNCIRCQCIIW